MCDSAPKQEFSHLCYTNPMDYTYAHGDPHLGCLLGVSTVLVQRVSTDSVRRLLHTHHNTNC